MYAEPKLQIIRDELELCGYFAIITSEKMNAKQAISLYKNRDVSEKLFRADKSYLGNGVLRVASQEAADNKIFIGFIALIIRCRIYTVLKDKVSTMVKSRIILLYLQLFGNWRKSSCAGIWITCIGWIMQ